MKPKLLLNLVLLVVLAALIGVALFEPGKEKPKPVVLTDVDVENLTHFELKNQENMVFEKQDGHWRLISPFSAPANEIRIRQLLKTAKSESRSQYPLKPDDLPKFELDKPKAVLNLGKATLVFGGSEPIDRLRYVQIGDTLHLVADDFSHHLTAKATDYVDKKLLPEDAKIKELQLPGLSAKLGDKGQWNMEPPGDKSAMSELANAWQSARAIEVTRQAQQAQGEMVRVVLDNGQQVEFVATQREPDLLLVRPDWKLEFMVPGEAGKRLLGLQPQPQDGEKGQDEEASETPKDKPDAAPGSGPGDDADKDAE